MKKDTTRDMTQGSPMKLILGFSVPLLFGFLFQQFYNVVDTIIVGRFLGVNALAGVGSTGSLNFLIIGFCMGVCNGLAIPLAHKFGAKDYSGLRRFMANGMWLSILFAVVMTIATTVFCRWMLIAMKTPEDIFPYAWQYIFIIFLGIPATYLYNMLSGIIRAMGDSKTPLAFLTLSSFLNIALDLICIINLNMGVVGAAVATVVSQAVSGVLCLIYMIKKFPLLRIKKEEWKGNLSYMGTLCGMGVPMGLQYSITAIGSVILQSVILYPFGAELSSLFMDAADEGILTNARMLLVINGIFYIPLAVVNIVRFLIQGMGFGTLAILAGVCEMVARSLAGMFLVPRFGFIGVCFASPLAWIFADAFLIPAYVHVRRKLDRIYAAE